MKDSEARTKEEITQPKLVTVCSQCLRASCWAGYFYCDDYKSAGTVEKTVPELEVLHLEHPRYWSMQ